MAVALSLSTGPIQGQGNTFGQFEASGDIGNPKLVGSASYDEVNQEYTLTAAGTNMWFGRDQFHFAWRKLKGDFILRTRVEFLGPGPPKTAVRLCLSVLLLWRRPRRPNRHKRCPD